MCPRSGTESNPGSRLTAPSNRRSPRLRPAACRGRGIPDGIRVATNSSVDRLPDTGSSPVLMLQLHSLRRLTLVTTSRLCGDRVGNDGVQQVRQLLGSGTPGVSPDRGDLVAAA